MYLDFSQKLNKVLEGVTKCLIIPHKNPDADALGSSMALSSFLIKLGKNTKVILPNSPPNYLEWMIKNHDVVSYEKSPEKIKKHLSKSEIIFALDFNSLKRIGTLSNELEKINLPIIMIDHHESPEKFSSLFLSKPEIGSTCEIVYNVIKSINHKLIDKEIATYIYSGILTDTGSFRYPLTSGDTHTIISELFKKGIDHTKIHEKIYDNFSFDRTRLLSVALKNLKLIKKLGVAYTILSKESLAKHNFKKGDTESFVNFGLRIEGISVSVIFIEDAAENIIKISFRSKNKIDVNKFAKKYFNGGGHKNASGGFSNNSIIETENKFISSIKDFLRV
ncbi:MAG: DHH family phosphoesterase [Flavobacteriaceae bacterium]|nr:DHH family phosphoesterase [Flavobacteriaceae bacterium]|tara:strand:+ start:1025 stop:2029 length:1005 start_codon:yes stop_codon:yes gene_type:complete